VVLWAYRRLLGATLWALLVLLMLLLLVLVLALCCRREGSARPPIVLVVNIISHTLRREDRCYDVSGTRVATAVAVGQRRTCRFCLTASRSGSSSVRMTSDWTCASSGGAFVYRCVDWKDGVSSEVLREHWRHGLSVERRDVLRSCIGTARTHAG
jgi:hypothetical protein